MRNQQPSASPSKPSSNHPDAAGAAYNHPWVPPPVFADGLEVLKVGVGVGRGRLLLAQDHLQIQPLVWPQCRRRSVEVSSTGVLDYHFERHVWATDPSGRRTRPDYLLVPMTVTCDHRDLADASGLALVEGRQSTFPAMQSVHRLSAEPHLAVRAEITGDCRTGVPWYDRPDVDLAAMYPMVDCVEQMVRVALAFLDSIDRVPLPHADHVLILDDQ